MEQNARFSSFLTGNLQREYFLQLANLQMQMLQRSVLFNGIMPILSSPLHFSSFLGGRMVRQDQLMSNQPQLSQNTNEQKVEIPKDDPKKSSRVLHS